MLAHFASYLWGWLGGLFNNLGSFLAGIGQSLGNAISSMFSWLGGLLHSLFQGLINGIAKILNAIFAPIFAIINAIFYFIEELGKVLLDLLKILVQVVHVFGSIAWGIIRTLTGLSYNNSAPALPADVSSPFAHMSAVLGALQLDNLAYVLRFGVWIIIAFAAMKIVGNWGVGE